jgi:hypothetical protein
MNTGASFQMVDSLDEVHQRQLSWFRTMAEGGSELAPAAALDYCARNGVTVPAWAMEIATVGYCNALTGFAPKKLGRSSGPIERYRQDINDHARWDEIIHLRFKQTELREHVEMMRARGQTSKAIPSEAAKNLAWVGHTMERAYECASMLLRETPAFGGPDAMKASYFRVIQTNREQAQPLRYHLFDPRFLARIGIEHPTSWGRGKKVVAFYNLTL